MNSLNLDSLLKFYDRFFFISNVNHMFKIQRFDKFQFHPTLFLSLIIFFICIFAILSQFFFNDGLPLFTYSARFFANISEYIGCSIAIIDFLCKRKQMAEFWYKINELNDFVYKQLGYRIMFKDFSQKFFNYIAMFMFLIIVFTFVRAFFIIDSISMMANISTLVFRALFVYIVSNSLFIIQLFKYLIQLTTKYIKCNHYQRESNILCVHTKCSMLNDLKAYKQLHFILYEIVTNINQTFGLIFMVLFYVGFVMATMNVFFMIHYLLETTNKWRLIRKC